MGSHQHPERHRGLQHAQRGQQQHLEQQGTDQGDDRIAADARVFHDGQRALGAGVAAQGIGHITETVFMEGAGQPDGGSGTEQGRQGQQQGRRCHEHDGAAPEPERARVNHGRHPTHQPANCRHVPHGVAHEDGTEAHPLHQRRRQRQAREELDGQQQVTQGVVHGWNCKPSVWQIS